MSVKIWNARRVPLYRLNEYLGECRKLTFAKIYKIATLIIHFTDLTATDQETAEIVKESPEVNPQKVFAHILAHKLLPALQADQASPENCLGNLHAGLNIWKDRRYAYIIPYARAVLATPEYSTDYHYQNQTDRPDNITARQWRARERKWKFLCLDDWNATRLYHCIVTFAPNEYYESLFALEDFISTKPRGFWNRKSK